MAYTSSRLTSLRSLNDMMELESIELSSILETDEIEVSTATAQKVIQIEQELAKVLDIDDLDAHIYLNLLRMGPVTASALAKELHVDRTKAYRTIDKLLNLKIVSTTFSKPKLCIANKPNDVLKIVLEKKESQVKKIRTAKDYIIRCIEETIPTNYSSNLPTFHITQGTQNIYSDIEKLLENAKGIVYIVTTLKDISKMYHTNIPEKIKICEKNGGEVRLLTEVSNNEHLPFVSRFGATEARIGTLSSKGRMVVEQKSQMIMSDIVWGDSDQTSVESDYAICTNSSEMVNNIFILSNLLWENAKALKKRSKQE